MKPVLKTVFVLSLLLVFSCAGSLDKEDIGPWLSAKTGNKPPQIDVSGKWKDARATAFGWGEGRLKQRGADISGMFGSYNVEGAVSGYEIYLVFLSGGAVYYTARLELLEEDRLTGNYFYPDDKEQENGYPMSLERVKEDA